MEERRIYILLTRSGTWFSHLIYFATRDSYTHASIGLDGPSGPFYSFARKYRHFALPAGLVEEQVTAYRFAVPCCLYELTVSEETYVRLRRQLRSMYAQREEYHYSVLGAFGAEPVSWYSEAKYWPVTAGELRGGGAAQSAHAAASGGAVPAQESAPRPPGEFGRNLGPGGSLKIFQ